MIDAFGVGEGGSTEFHGDVDGRDGGGAGARVEGGAAGIEAGFVGGDGFGCGGGFVVVVVGFSGFFFLFLLVFSGHEKGGATEFLFVIEEGDEVGVVLRSDQRCR